MNELINLWDKLSKEKFIFTKHNYLNVYNFGVIKQKLIDDIYVDIAKEKGFESIDQFNDWLNRSLDIDRNIIDSEIEKRLKDSDLYKQTISELRRVNKYKSKAFELLIQKLLDTYYENLNGENEFAKIFEQIDLTLKENNKSFYEYKENFNIIDINDKYKYSFKKLNFKDTSIEIGFGINENPLEYNKGEIIEKEFFKQDKEYIFEIDLNFPILKIKNGYLFFYEVDYELKYMKAQNYDEIIEKHLKFNHQSLTKTYFKKYCVLCTAKQFEQLFFMKSQFLSELKNINYIKNYRFVPLLKEYTHKNRPDLWQYENGELLFVEIKFNEYTDFSIESINNTINYVNKFNKICSRNGSNLKVNKINLVHNERKLSSEILKEIDKKKQKYDINLISIYDLLERYIEDGRDIPSKIIVSKNNTKTNREIEYSITKPRNIIIDLTEVTQ